MANPEVGLTKHRRPFPYGDIIVVEEIKEEFSAGGIFLPDYVEKEARGRPVANIKISMGKVLAVGHGQYTDAGVLVPLPTKVGEIIAYQANGVRKYKLDGEDYALVTLNAVIARISDDPYE